MHLATQMVRALYLHVHNTSSDLQACCFNVMAVHDIRYSALVHMSDSVNHHQLCHSA